MTCTIVAYRHTCGRHLGTAASRRTNLGAKMTTLTQQRPEVSAAIPKGRIFKILGALTAALGFAVVAGPGNAVELVTNGSFETGDFTGWTQVGNTGFGGVECPGAPFAGPGDGNCDAFFGPVGSTGGITQTLNT